MAGLILKDPFKPAAHGVIFLDFPDAFGQGRHKGRLYRWSFHNYLGPLFLRTDGEPMVRQPGERSRAWVPFNRWLKARSRARTGVLMVHSDSLNTLHAAHVDSQSLQD